jgi:hypothetical protein
MSKLPVLFLTHVCWEKHKVPFDPQHQSANVRCRTEDKARQGQEHHLDISTVTVGRMLRFKHI